MKHFAVASAVTVAALGATVWQLPPVFAQQAAAATRTTVERGVTIKVTPGKLTDSGWEFSVVLDTHSEELKDDLEKSAVLVVDGQEVRPVQWQGPPAGGHHREGVLRFPAPGSRPGAVELKLTRAGEAEPRVFRWEGLQSQ